MMAAAEYVAHVCLTAMERITATLTDVEELVNTIVDVIIQHLI